MLPITNPPEVEAVDTISPSTDSASDKPFTPAVLPPRRSGQEEHDAVSWLVLDGSVLLFDWCEPLSVLGHGEKMAEFLVWATLAMESMVSLSTVKVRGNRAHDWLVKQRIDLFRGLSRVEAVAGESRHTMPSCVSVTFSHSKSARCYGGERIQNEGSGRAVPKCWNSVTTSIQLCRTDRPVRSLRLLRAFFFC